MQREVYEWTEVDEGAETRMRTEMIEGLACRLWAVGWIASDRSAERSRRRVLHWPTESAMSGNIAERDSLFLSLEGKGRPEGGYGAKGMNTQARQDREEKENVLPMKGRFTCVERGVRDCALESVDHQAGGLGTAGVITPHVPKLLDRARPGATAARSLARYGGFGRPRRFVRSPSSLRHVHYFLRKKRLISPHEQVAPSANRELRESVSAPGMGGASASMERRLESVGRERSSSFGY